MIISTTKQFKRYLGLNKNFGLILDFIKNNDLKTLECKKYDMGGGNLANVFETKNYEENFVTQKLEGHIEYIDVQVPIVGKEILFFDDINDCKICEEYNKEKDVLFVNSQNLKKCQVLENEMMILFPEDAHYAVMCDNFEVGKKVVFKIKVK